MTQITEYGSILLILLMAIIVTGVAAWRISLDANKDKKDEDHDGWGFPIWFTPLGYLMIAWFFVGTSGLNQPISVLITFFAYSLSVFLLFLSRSLPSSLKWHYPIGAAVFLMLFL